MLKLFIPYPGEFRKILKIFISDLFKLSLKLHPIPCSSFACTKIQTKILKTVALSSVALMKTLHISCFFNIYNVKISASYNFTICIKKYILIYLQSFKVSLKITRYIYFNCDGALGPLSYAAPIQTVTTNMMLELFIKINLYLFSNNI